MIRAIIFDFDGLVLETELPEFQTWQELYQQHGCELTEEFWLPIVGLGASTNPFDPFDHLQTQIGRTLDREQVLCERERRYIALAESQAILPGVEQYIADARRLGLKLGVASSSPRQWVEGHLQRLGLLDNFDCLCCGDEVRLTKPDPELYLTALEKLGVQPSEAIALEDSPNGMRAAKAAGMFGVAIPSVLTRAAAFDTFDLRLESLADLPLEELIAQLSERPVAR